jgi:gliding motility-associated protein GldM
MAGYKETPRQKMITMMYLVLTALLALNVSKEVLDAFIVVNDSVVQTNETFAEKTNDLHRTFENRYMINQARVAPYRERALEAKQLSDDLRAYINDIKWRLISEVEGIPYDSAKVVPPGKLENMDNYDGPTTFFMGGSTDGSEGEGWVLMEKINQYREDMLNILDEQEREKIRIGLQTDGHYTDRDGVKLNWVQYNFYRTVLAANLAILNKIITEIYNAEFDIVNHLMVAIDAEDFKYDTIALKVLPKRDYVFVGENYEAEIIVAAYDTKQEPEVYIMEGVDSLPVSQTERARRISGDDGVVKVNLPANTEGTKRFAGIFRIVTPSGEVNDYPFSSQYQVAKPATTISATKMNVFYAGVDNPISISSPGVPLENLEVSISAGSITRDAEPGNYIVNVPAEAGEAVVSVSARIEGIIRKQGDMTFRVKTVPDPIAQIAGMREGPINRNVLARTTAIEARMPQDFEFDMNFNVVSFTMLIARGTILSTYTASSNRLTDDMTSAVQNANRGDRVWFENILARGADGKDRNLPSISLTLN